MADDWEEDRKMIQRVKTVISEYDLDAASGFYEKESDEVARRVILEVVDALTEVYELKRIG